MKARKFFSPLTVPNAVGFLVAGFFSLAVGTTPAQTTKGWGIYHEANVNLVFPESSFSSTVLTGGLGFYVIIPLADRWSLSYSMGHQRKGFNADAILRNLDGTAVGLGTLKYRMDYLNTSIGFQFHAADFFYIEFTPVFNLIADATSHVNYFATASSTVGPGVDLPIEAIQVRDFETSASLKFGFQQGPRWQYILAFNAGITPAINNDEGFFQDVYVRMDMIQVSTRLFLTREKKDKVTIH